MKKLVTEITFMKMTDNFDTTTGCWRFHARSSHKPKEMTDLQLSRCIFLLFACKYIKMLFHTTLDTYGSSILFTLLFKFLFSDILPKETILSVLVMHQINTMKGSTMEFNSKSITKIWFTKMLSMWGKHHHIH